jgi:hypothetical protein
MNRRTRIAITSFVPLAVIAGVPVWLTWRAVRQEKLNHALIAAIEERKTDAIVSLLKQGADPNAREHSGGTLSIWQAFRNLFLRFRQRDTAAPQEGNPALLVAFEAVDLHFSDVDPHIISALLDAGANPNCRDVDEHITPLELAVQDCPSQVRHLLDKGADVNARDDRGSTALMGADDPAVIRLLLDRGADINAQDADGQTALMQAVERNQTQTVKTLLARHADVGIKDKSGLGVLVKAYDPVSPEIIRLLKQAGAQE